MILALLVFAILIVGIIITIAVEDILTSKIERDIRENWKKNDETETEHV